MAQYLLTFQVIHSKCESKFIIGPQVNFRLNHALEMSTIILRIHKLNSVENAFSSNENDHNI